MARVKLIVNKEDIAPEHHALFDKLAALRGRISGPSTVVLHSPGLARPWHEISEDLHRGGGISPENADMPASRRLRAKAWASGCNADGPQPTTAGQPPERVQ